MPDFIMPPRSPLMISLLRHARLQRGLQLHHNHSTLRKLYERHLDCLLALLQAHVRAASASFAGMDTTTYTIFKVEKIFIKMQLWVCRFSYEDII